MKLKSYVSVCPYQLSPKSSFTFRPQHEIDFQRLSWFLALVIRGCLPRFFFLNYGWSRSCLFGVHLGWRRLASLLFQIFWSYYSWFQEGPTFRPFLYPKLPRFPALLWLEQGFYTYSFLFNSGGWDLIFLRVKWFGVFCKHAHIFQYEFFLVFLI